MTRRRELSGPQTVGDHLEIIRNFMPLDAETVSLQKKKSIYEKVGGSC